MAYQPQITSRAAGVKTDFPDDPVDDLYPGAVPPWGERPIGPWAREAVRRMPAAGAPKPPGVRAMRAAAALASPRRQDISKPRSKPVPENRGTITLVSWRPFEKNTLRGFANIGFPMGLVIRDITVHEKNGKKWVGMPAKIQLDAAGEIRRKPDGKPEYVAVLEWSDRDLAERFGARVIGLIEDRHGQIMGEPL